MPLYQVSLDSLAVWPSILARVSHFIAFIGRLRLPQSTLEYAQNQPRMPIRHQHTMRLYASQLPLPTRVSRVVMSNVAEAVPDPDLPVGQDTAMGGLALPVTRHVSVAAKLNLLKHHTTQEMLRGNCIQCQLFTTTINNSVRFERSCCLLRGSPSPSEALM